MSLTKFVWRMVKNSITVKSVQLWMKLWHWESEKTVVKIWHYIFLVLFLFFVFCIKAEVWCIYWKSKNKSFNHHFYANSTNLRKIKVIVLQNMENSEKKNKIKCCLVHKKECLFPGLNTGKHLNFDSEPFYKVEISHQYSSKKMKRLSLY